MDRAFWNMPKAVFTVMFLWLIVTTVLSGGDFVYAWDRLLYALLGMSVAVVGGIILWRVFSQVLLRDHIRSKIEGGHSKELDVKLYTSNKKNCTIIFPKVPLPRTKLPSAKMKKSILKKWGGYEEYKKQHPDHAKLFNEIYRILSYYDYLPATHHAKGHGGLSLIEHSMNVVRLMTKLGHQFKYYGAYQNNRLIGPLQEESNLKRGYYQVEKGDPILPIIALAHDIGKVKAFKSEVEVESGFSLLFNFLKKKDAKQLKVVRVDGAHDLLGKRLLLQIPEIYLLSWQERNDIMNAVGYHHHHALPKQMEDNVIQGLPYSSVTSDRQHALAALLEYVDTQTSFLEGGDKIKPYFVPAGFKQSQPQDTDFGESKNPSETPPNPSANHEVDTHETTQTPSHARQDEVEEDEVTPQVFEWLKQILKAETKSKRGNSRLNRLDGWVYLDELYWRNWLFKQGKSVQEPETLTIKAPAKLHPVTLELLEIIEEKGGFPASVDTQANLPKLFVLNVDRTNGEPFVRNRVIVFKESIIPFRIGIKKSRNAIEIVGQAGLELQAEPMNEKPHEPAPTQEGPPLNETNHPHSASTEEASQNSTQSKASEALPPKKQLQNQGNGSSQEDLIKANVDAFIEWVSLVQNLEIPDEIPFPEIKEKGRPYALVDVLAVPKRFIDGGQLIGIDPRLELNVEAQNIKVPVQHKKRMRN